MCSKDPKDRAERSRRLAADLDEFDVKDEGCTAGDETASAAVTVAEVGRDGEDPLLADAHAGHAEIPALDHLADAL